MPCRQSVSICDIWCHWHIQNNNLVGDTSVTLRRRSAWFLAFIITIYPSDCLHVLRTAQCFSFSFPLSLLVWYVRQTKLASCQFLIARKIFALYLLTYLYFWFEISCHHSSRQLWFYIKGIIFSGTKTSVAIFDLIFTEHMSTEQINQSCKCAEQRSQRVNEIINSFFA